MAPAVRDIAGYAGAELIGSGGFGAVYRATDAAHGRDVAIKVLQGSLGEAERRRFDRERQTMGRLGAHPYIIPVYESGYTEAGEGYIVMELATGGSLRDRFENAPMPWTEAVKVMAAVADAIQAAHDNGVLHRDIKPDNILIDQFNNPKLSDFGIAAVASNQTATTSTTATLAHAAPELLEGKPSTPSVDIYALGSTLYSLIAGRPPFVRADDNNAAAMIARVVTEAPPDLRAIGVPDSVADIIEQALSKNPDHRQATAAQLASELRSAPRTQAAPTQAAPTQAAQTEVVSAEQLWSAPNPNETQISAAPLPNGPNSGPIAPGSGQPGLGYPASTGRPPPPSGYGPPPSPPTAAVQPGVPSAPDASAPYSTNQSWKPPPEPISKAGGANRSVLLFAVGFVVVLVVGGLVALVVNATGELGAGPSVSTVVSSTVVPSTVSTTDTTTTTDSTTNGSDVSAPPTSTLAGFMQPTVRIECPTEIALNTTVACSIHTANVISGEWHLPAFLIEPEAIEIVPGENKIFIEPTSPEAIGQTYTVTATAEDADGETVNVSHSFRVVAVLVEIDCPETIALNSSVVCDIVSTNATEGEWDIAGFGSATLEVIPGTNPISIEPNDASSVGQTYTITATVRDGVGQSHTAMSTFVVGPPEG